MKIPMKAWYLIMLIIVDSDIRDIEGIPLVDVILTLFENSKDDTMFKVHCCRVLSIFKKYRCLL